MITHRGTVLDRQHSSHSSIPDRYQTDRVDHTITVVFWYKASHEPYRATIDVPEWPIFRLTYCLPNLLSELQLEEDSFVETYNEKTAHWEQRRLNTVRKVAPSQTLLYKLRAPGSGLLSGGMKDYECLGVQREIDRVQQHQLDTLYPERILIAGVAQNERNRKRTGQSFVGEDERPYKRASYGSLVDYSLTVHPKSYHQQDQYYRHSPPPLRHHRPPPPLPPLPQQQQQQQKINDYIPVQHHAAPPPPASPTTSTSSSTPIAPAKPPPPSNPNMDVPHRTHPPLLRFPNDYHVCTISELFAKLDDTMSQSIKAGSGLTQKVAFERIFGTRYVKSTWCRHRSVFRSAAPEMRDKYIRLGKVEEAIWGEFVRRVEGRASALSK